MVMNHLSQLLKLDSCIDFFFFFSEGGEKKFPFHNLVYVFIFLGMCADCGLKVVGEGSGCTAMDRVFHIACFTCRVCACRLQGKPFYAVEGEPHCQECYLVIMRIYLSFTHMDTFFMMFY